MELRANLPRHKKINTKETIRSNKTMEWLLDESYCNFIMELHNEYKAKYPNKTDEQVAKELKPYVVSGYEGWKVCSNIRKNLQLDGSL